MKKAIYWTLFWIALAVIVGLGVLVFAGPTAAAEYTTAYIIEKTLSVDNLFVFAMLFKAFQMDERNQHKLLNWGIIGAIILRGTLILAGAATVTAFHWMVYVFGAILIFMAFKMLNSNELDFEYQFDFMKKIKKMGLNPFMTCLITVEISDFLFAFDSIPAALAITQTWWIICLSNLMAVLGLRSLYFVLMHAVMEFENLQTGIAVVLALIGTKILISPWVEIPTWVSLVATVMILGVSLIGGKPRAEEAI